MDLRVTATRRLQFCAGHRVMGHESKCRHLHGHNYVVYLQAEAMDDDGEGGLDPVGRVIDFSVLKERFGEWIEREWDHGFILSANDVHAFLAMRAFGNREGLTQKVHMLPFNPTAENLARYLLVEVGPSLLQGSGVRLTRVTIYETENCIAEARL